MKKVMIDLETMSIKKNAAILSIGAVVFDMFGVNPDGFYTNVDLGSCIDAGLVKDASTMEFWSRSENSGAFDELMLARVPLKQALQEFRSWMLADANHDDIEVWANGSSFDLAILETAYEHVGLPHPWKFYNEMDYRTMKKLYKVQKPPFRGTKHNAQHDARNQAEHLCAILKVVATQNAHLTIAKALAS